MAEMTAQLAVPTLKMVADQMAAKDRRYGTAEELRSVAALLEQQAAEIERLQIREHRMIEYMRDIKNFAFTINEVANNAIEEAEVQG